MTIEGENQVDGTPAADAAAAAGDQAAAGDSAAKGATPTLESLQAELTAKDEQLQAAQMRLLDPDYQDFIASKRTRGAEPAPAASAAPVDPLAGLSEEQLNAMSNKEILATAVARAVESISVKLRDELLPEIEQRIGSLGDTVADQAARREVAEAAAKFPDFWQYQKDMVAMSVQPKYDGLGAEDLYFLAKAARSAASGASGSPAKPAPAQKVAARAGSEKPGVGGGGPASGSPKVLTAEEAGEDAWDKVFGKK